MINFLQVTNSDQKQLQMIAQRFIEEIDDVKHALAKREKIGVLKLPFELYHPYQSLPVKTGSSAQRICIPVQKSGACFASSDVLILHHFLYRYHGCGLRR